MAFCGRSLVAVVLLIKCLKVYYSVQAIKDNEPKKSIKTGTFIFQQIRSHVATAGISVQFPLKFSLY